MLAGAVFAIPASAAKGPPVLPEAVYKGKGTKLQISSDGGSVTVFALPEHNKCKGKTPTNLGDYAPTGLGPFPIAANGSFSNRSTSSDAFSLKGRFKGTAVSGTLRSSGFKDTAKGFDCADFSGAFSANLVKGTGLKPGKVLARDDFSNPKSGFDVFNTTNGFSEYLKDKRFRVGLRGNAGVTALRAKPANLATAEVDVTVFTFGGEPGDEVGLVCQAIDPQNFLAGYVTQNGTVRFARYVAGARAEASTPASLPAGTVKTGQGARNDLRLVCAPQSDGATRVDLFVNGSSKFATSSKTLKGATGISVFGNGNGTDYNFTNYVVRVPKS